VVAELPPEDKRRLIDQGRERLLEEQPVKGKDPRQATLPLGPAAEVGRRLLERLQFDTATHIDVLLEQVEDISSSEIIAALFEMEMLGLVKQLPGRNYLKVW